MSIFINITTHTKNVRNWFIVLFDHYIFKMYLVLYNMGIFFFQNLFIILGGIWLLNILFKSYDLILKCSDSAQILCAFDLQNYKIYGNKMRSNWPKEFLVLCRPFLWKRPQTRRKKEHLNRQSIWVQLLTICLLNLWTLTLSTFGELWNFYV